MFKLTIYYAHTPQKYILVSIKMPNAILDVWLFFNSKRTSWHIFCSKLAAGWLSKNIVFASPTMVPCLWNPNFSRSRPSSPTTPCALRLSRVLWWALKLFECPRFDGKFWETTTWIIDEWRFNGKSRQVQCSFDFICIRGVYYFKICPVALLIQTI